MPPTINNEPKRYVEQPVEKRDLSIAPGIIRMGRRAFLRRAILASLTAAGFAVSHSGVAQAGEGGIGKPSSIDSQAKPQPQAPEKGGGEVEIWSQLEKAHPKMMEVLPLKRYPKAWGGYTLEAPPFRSTIFNVEIPGIQVKNDPVAIAAENLMAWNEWIEAVSNQLGVDPLQLAADLEDKESYIVELNIPVRDQVTQSGTRIKAERVKVDVMKGIRKRVVPTEQLEKDPRSIVQGQTQAAGLTTYWSVDVGEDQELVINLSQSSQEADYRFFKDGRITEEKYQEKLVWGGSYSFVVEAIAIGNLTNTLLKNPLYFQNGHETIKTQADVKKAGLPGNYSPGMLDLLSRFSMVGAPRWTHKDQSKLDLLEDKEKSGKITNLEKGTLQNLRTKLKNKDFIYGAPAKDFGAVPVWRNQTEGYGYLWDQHFLIDRTNPTYELVFEQDLLGSTTRK